MKKELEQRGRILSYGYRNIFYPTSEIATRALEVLREYEKDADFPLFVAQLVKESRHVDAASVLWAAPPGYVYSSYKEHTSHGPFTRHVVYQIIGPRLMWVPVPANNIDDNIKSLYRRIAQAENEQWGPPNKTSYRSGGNIHPRQGYVDYVSGPQDVWRDSHIVRTRHPHRNDTSLYRKYHSARAAHFAAEMLREAIVSTQDPTHILEWHEKDDWRWDSPVDPYHEPWNVLAPSQHTLTAWGIEQSIADWARDPKCPVNNYHTLYQRSLILGWDDQRTVETPLP